MSQRLYKIRGIRSDSRGKAVGGRSPSQRLFPGSARDGAADDVEVAGDTVVRVELDNGFVLWSRVDDLTREYGTPPAGSRGDGSVGDGAWEFSRLTPQRASGSERGMAGLAIRVLDFFGIDLVEASARELGKAFEEKQLAWHAATRRKDFHHGLQARGRCLRGRDDPGALRENRVDAQAGRTACAHPRGRAGFAHDERIVEDEAEHRKHPRERIDLFSDGWMRRVQRSHERSRAAIGAEEGLDELRNGVARRTLCERRERRCCEPNPTHSI